MVFKIAASISPAAATQQKDFPLIHPFIHFFPFSRKLIFSFSVKDDGGDDGCDGDDDDDEDDDDNDDN